MKFISFDLDETLVDNSRIAEVVQATSRDLAKQTGVPVDQIVQANNSAFTAVFETDEEDWVFGRISGAELSFRVWSEALGSLGVNEPQVARDAVDYFWPSYVEAPKLFPDALSTLEGKADAKLAIITNGAPSHRQKIRRLGIEDRFEAIVIAGEVGLMKPDPGIFTLAAELLGCDNTELWHIGDWPSTDVAGAQAAGCVAVWFNHRDDVNETGATPDHEIRTLAEILSI